MGLVTGCEECGGGKCGGSIIQAGQQIGTVGSAAETELGFNPNWGSLYGPSTHPGPWPSDPRQWLAALATGAPATTTTTSSSSAGTNPPSPSAGGSTTYPSACPQWDLDCRAASFFISNYARHVCLLSI